LNNSEIKTTPFAINLGSSTNLERERSERGYTWSCIQAVSERKRRGKEGAKREIWRPTFDFI